MIKVYLACPYFHKDENIRNERFEEVCRKAGELMEMGYVVFSPISHNHPIKKFIKSDNDNWQFWKKQDFRFIEWCDEFHILCLDGWKESNGVNSELDFATSLLKNIITHTG